MRIKISAHQNGEFHHFCEPKFAAFYHWKMPHIWTLFRPAAPPAPKRGENILKGIRGPDTPPVSPSAWPAQPAGLNGSGADSPPLSRSPRDLPCGRSRGPYCASAHAAACPPGALLRQRQGRDACAPRPCRCLPACGGFFLDGYKGASARPASPRTPYPSRRLFGKSHRSLIQSRLLSESRPLTLGRDSVFGEPSRRGALKPKSPGNGQRTRQRGRFPLYSSVCWQAVPMNQRGTLAPPAQE